MKLKIALVALFTVILIAAVVTVSPAPAQTAPRRIEITASRFKYEPAEITLKKDEPVVIVLKSADVTHGLRFRDLNFNVKAEKGQTSELPFTPTKTGDFVGQCSVFCGSGHGKMKLTLHVVE
jgi:cytochrome c oxidase subunit II